MLLISQPQKRTVVEQLNKKRVVVVKWLNKERVVVMWLNKKRDLFGMSSKEATKTRTAKVLVLWHPTKKASNLKDNLYSEVGSMRILALRRKGTMFVIQEEEVTEFVKSWLATCE